MSDRTINFGESESEATYQIQDTDSTGGGNFVVAKDTNANTVLLQYDPDTDTWEYAGDVDINGGNVSGVGTLTADSVNTEEQTLDGSDLESQLKERSDIIAFDIDSEGGTNLDLSITGIDSGEMDKFELVVVSYNSSNSADYFMRINGVESGGEYQHRIIDGTTIVEDSDRDEIIIGLSDNSRGAVFKLEVVEFDARRIGVSTISNTVVRALSANKYLINGGMDSDEGPLDEINIFTNETDRAYCYLKRTGVQGRLL